MSSLCMEKDTCAKNTTQLKNDLKYKLENINVVTNKQTRCSFSTCKTKLKLFDMGCKCEKRFCMKHRFPEEHNCDYDYTQRDSSLADKMRCVACKTVDKI